ncbi:MAG: hypothetical protein F4X44_05710 [Gammaproteobacteria bacterium]|nr:hypothetical protein [Gammaproteobacteria bacterium]MYD80088.1 hypothetical protein [Gammaproteobacteria bacterium]
MKPIKLNLLSIVGLTLVAFAAGAFSYWAVAWFWGNGEQDSTRAIASLDKDDLEQDFLAVTQVKGDLARSLALLRILDRASTSQLADLLTLSVEIEPASLASDLQIPVVRRFAMIDPQLALSHIERLPDKFQANLVSAVFGEWSQNAFDEAVSSAEDLQKSMQSWAFQGILASGHESADELRDQIDGTDALGSLGSHFSNEATQRIPTQSPREAWQTLVHQSGGSIGNLGALIDIGDEWVQEEGISVLQEIKESGKLDQDLQWAVFGSLVYESAKRDPKQTFEHMLSLEGNERNNYTLGAVLAWAESDAMAALEAANAVEDTWLRVSLLQQVLSEVAARDPRQLLADMEALPSNVQEIAKEHVVIETARSDPEEAVRLLDTLNVSDSEIIQSIVDYWSKSNPLEALDWVLNGPIPDEDRKYLGGRAISVLVDEQPDLAMKLALEQPVDWGWEAFVIAELAKSDAFEAIKLLPQLRDSQVQFAYDSIGYGLIHQGHAKSVIKLAAQVPEQLQEAFYSNMTSNWAFQDPLELLNSIDELPSPELRSKAAYALSSQFHALNTLTDEQVELAKTYLNEWDTQRLDKSQTHFRFVGASQELRFAGTPDQVELLIEEVGKLMEEVKSEDSTD